MLLVVLFGKIWMLLGKVLHKRRYSFPSVYSVVAFLENSAYLKAKQEKWSWLDLALLNAIFVNNQENTLTNSQLTLRGYPALSCCGTGRVCEGHLLPLLPQLKENFWIKEKPLCSIFLLEKLRSARSHYLIKLNLDCILDALKLPKSLMFSTLPLQWFCFQRVLCLYLGTLLPKIPEPCWLTPLQIYKSPCQVFWSCVISFSHFPQHWSPALTPFFKSSNQSITPAEP